MVYEFKFPDVGEGITEGEIVKWKVKPGDTVKVDDVLCEIETDKAVVEIPSPKAGKIIKVSGKEGDVIKVGDTLVEIDETGKAEVKAEEPAEKPEEKKEEKEKPKGASVVGVLEEAPEEEEPPKEKKAEKKPKKAIVATTPAARKIAKEKGIDLSSLKGTGPEGIITEKDLEAAPEGAKPPAKPAGVKVTKKYDLYGYVKREPFRGMRRTIAKNLVKSAQTVAAVTHMDEADVTRLWEVRAKEKANAEKKGIKLTFLPFVVKALIAGLKEHPKLNATLDEENNEIILKQYYNIGIAVDTGGGLIVPVIKGADEKSILDIAKEIEEMAKKAKDRKIDLGDLKGGTFTITNYGSVGGKFGTPIINPSECAIMGIGRIYEKVVMIKGSISVRKILPISITFDHRITDGAEVARFANTVMQHLEDPDLMLIEAEG